MITQKIKRWLNRLFAWWPWKRSPETSYAQAISNMNPGLTLDSMLRNTVDGPIPQTGNTSVAVEQGNEDIPESSRPTAEERSEPLLSSHPFLPEETPNLLSSPAKKENLPDISTSQPSPTPEQKLAFLQYLVKRGLINEGFSAEQIPRQYKKFHQ